MSTASATSASGRSKVFRGRSVAELIPTIQAELGPDAIVIARRSGLEGGVGGFFQRPFVEIEAQAGGAGGGQVDLYDGEEAMPGQLLTEGAPAAIAAPAPMPAPSSFDALSFPTVAAPEPPIGTSRAAADDAAAFADVLAAANSEPITVMRSAPEHEALSESEVSTGSLAARHLAALPDHEALSQSGMSEPGMPEPGMPKPGMPEPGMPEPGMPEPGMSRSGMPEPGMSRSGVSSCSLVEQHETTLSGPSFTAGRSTPAEVARSDAPSAPSLSRTALAVVQELQAVGFDEAFARELLDAAGAHVLPFAPRIGLRKAVRTALARRIPTAAPLPCAGATLALVGPGGSGKTKSVAGLAASYRRAGTLSVGCASISGEAGVEPLQMVFSPHITAPLQARSARALKAIAAASAGGLVLVDTPPVSPAEAGAIRELARLLGELAPDSTVIALPATLGAKAAAQLLEALRPLKASAVAITHADETDQLGLAVQAACAFGLAPEYLLTGARGARALTRLDPTTLAERLLP